MAIPLFTDIALARRSPKFQALDPYSVELFEGPENDESTCYICGSADGKTVAAGSSAQIIIYLSHTRCGQRAHLHCLLEWLENACYCPMCKGCLKGHGGGEQCRRTVDIQEDVDRLDTIEFLAPIPRSQNRHWTQLIESPSGNISSHLRWLQAVPFHVREVYPSAAFSLTRYRFDLSHDTRHNLPIATLVFRRADVREMNRLTRATRADWRQKWNEFARNISRNPAITLSDITIFWIRDYARNIVMAFWALKAREKVADFLYHRTVKRIVAGGEGVESLSLSANAVNSLVCLFSNAAHRVKPYELADGTPMEFKDPNETIQVLKARMLWLGRRIFACAWFQEVVEACTRSLERHCESPSFLPPKAPELPAILEIFDSQDQAWSEIWTWDTGTRPN